MSGKGNDNGAHITRTEDRAAEGRNETSEDMTLSTETSASEHSILNVTLESNPENVVVPPISIVYNGKMRNLSPASTWVSAGSVISSSSSEIVSDSKSLMDGSDENLGEGAGVSSSEGLYEGIGPSFRAGVLIVNEDEQEDSSGDVDMDAYGPSPPPPSLNASDTDITDSGAEIGPQPFSGESDGHAEMEYARMRLELESKCSESNLKRDEWMLKAPKNVVNNGFEPRQFKRGSTASSEFDASWEDSPMTKKSRVEGNAGTSTIAVDSTRDEEQRKMFETFDVGRQQSLMDSHKQTDKEAKSKNTGGERVPFDREKDVAEGGKKKPSSGDMKSRFGNLGSRFSSGSGQHFL